MISKNITKIRKKIDPNVQLIVVTKNRTPEEIEAAIQAGATIIGENRVQEAREKFPKLKSSVQKHFIGHLQTNKVKYVVPLFDMIQSVDSLYLAEKIDQIAAKHNKKMPVLLEVNIANDPQKYGFTEQELRTILPELHTLPNLQIKGLMTIVPYFEDPEKARPYFHQMKKLQTELNFPELSMGMSNDYQIAAQEGATMVRIGTAIFA
ncbi:YggS family pyridoxal phosphate-dependent enzyme [Candidatus Peregrinibacteria bacterium]|jgi:PLP dependent protein|nr:YggS family pyridoxal phosphate-dependent enzyme [Candidatus Peregrinibacteria bacterium]MBT7702642.1 YggS family pyridoxal phosphate-dependent enzyme [Candidatus Peregrinibacteria bacterium]